MSVSAMMTNDNGKKPFTLDQLRRIAPTVFQTEPHSSRSDNYKPVPTIAVLEALRTVGWEPYSVQQSVVRDESKAHFNKHLLRLRQGNAKELVDATIQRGHHVFVGNGPEYNELILTNSHDGSSSFELTAGRFRLVCLNGLIMGKTFGSVRVPHRGNVEDLVIDGATRIVDHFTEIDTFRAQMAEIELDFPSRLAFGQQALNIRYGDNAPILPESLIASRRREDCRHDLWTVYNVVQENMIKGGIRGVTQAGRGMRTRTITGIDQDMSLNKRLWDLADFVRRVARGEKVVEDAEAVEA